jgi:hypothetical protein
MIFSLFVIILSSKVGVYFRKPTNMDTSTLGLDNVNTYGQHDEVHSNMMNILTHCRLHYLVVMN